MKNLSAFAATSLLVIIGCSSYGQPIISNEQLATSHIECSYHQFYVGEISLPYDTIDCTITDRSGFISKKVCWDMMMTCDDTITKRMHFCGEARPKQVTYYVLYVSDYNFNTCKWVTDLRIEHYQ